jgi:hypothetical protein
MLTCFSIPKAFRGHTGIIQHNAIKSWTLMRPRPEIILFGDDEGTAEAAKSFSVRHVPQVARNEYGTPLLNDLFEQAQRAAAHDVLCYVNADVILMRDFFQAVDQVVRWKTCFLLVGQRWDIDVRESLDFFAGWENDLRTRLSGQGVLHPSTGMDYFVFPRGMWGDIPPFAIGRTAWDNWLVYRARARRVPVVDATDALTVVHQAHDYSHVPAKAGDVLKGPEAKRNLNLAGGWKHIFTLKDATHVLGLGGPRLAISPKHLQRRLITVPTLYSFLELSAIFAKPIILGFRRVWSSSRKNPSTEEASFDARR